MHGPTPILFGMAAGVADIDGDFIEFGVWTGKSYLPLLDIAESQRKWCHGVDSFAGMAEPCEHDGTMYPKGKLDGGGPAAIQQQVMMRHNAMIHVGYIPDVLDGIVCDDLFSFAHLDLDHYTPTLDALRWVWPRMAKGGVVICHDYFIGKGGLASLAIDTFVAEKNLKLYVGEDTYAWLRA